MLEKVIIAKFEIINRKEHGTLSSLFFPKEILEYVQGNAV